jgi:hypothetical protein
VNIVALCKYLYVWGYDLVEGTIVVIWLCEFDLVLEGGFGAQCADLMFGEKHDSVA